MISVIYLGIVPTGVAWLLRFRILKNNGLIFQSQVSYLIPIFGTILGYIFLKELITIKVLISLIAVCIGIYFVKKADNKKTIQLVIALICEGLVSQHPPSIVAPLSLNFLTISSIFLGVRSSLCPKNSFGLPLDFEKVKSNHFLV